MASADSRLRNNRPLQIVSRVLGCALAAGTPTITYLWGDRGLTPGDFYLLEIIFALVLLVLEVLTGRFADRYGKVLTLKLGFLAHLAGSLTYASATTFSGFLGGEVLFAFGIALISGTDEALLFQSGKALGEERHHKWWWSFSLCTGFVSMGCFAIVGAWLGTINLSYPYLLAAGCSVFALIICFLMIEPPLGIAEVGVSSQGTLWQAIHSVLFASPVIRWMAVAPGFVVAVNQTYLWMYPGYLKDCQLSVIQSGYVFALFNLIAGASALVLRKIEDGRAGMRVFFVLLVVLAVSTIGLIHTVGIWAWLILIPQQVVRSLSGGLFSHSINAAIPDQVRATALSVRNAVRVILYVSVMIPWWLGVNSLGRNGMFTINLLMLVVGAVFFWITCPEEDRVHG